MLGKIFVVLFLRQSLCSSDCPGTHYVDLKGFLRVIYFMNMSKYLHVFIFVYHIFTYTTYLCVSLACLVSVELEEGI